MKKTEKFNINVTQNAYRHMYSRLFSFAYMITGDERLAERALINVIMSIPSPEEDREEEVRNAVIVQALRLFNAGNDGYFSFTYDERIQSTPLSEWLFSIDEKKARVIVLRYGIGLSVKDIGRIMQMHSENVKRVLESAIKTAAKGKKDKKQAYASLKNTCCAIAESACYPPDFSMLMRSMERIQEDSQSPESRMFSVRPMISWLTAGAMLLVIAMIIWLSVVLLSYFRDLSRPEKEAAVVYKNVRVEDREWPRLKA